jgi:K+ transport systems, NAD-binding component
MADASKAERDVVLVCGLGRLGQHCARMLKTFAVHVHAVEAHTRDHWVLPQSPALIDRIVIGDCRLPAVLDEAEVRRCRAILLVTGDDRTNIVTALSARSLNPGIRVVLRSAQESLNALLSRTLGNLAAFEPTQLGISAFALAALGEDLAGLFSVDNRLIPVMRREITAADRWRNRRLGDVDTHHCRIVAHTRAGAPPAADFYAWDPEDQIEVGDVITFIDPEGSPTALSRPHDRQEPRAPGRWWRTRASRSSLRDVTARLWRKGGKLQRVGVLIGGLLIGLYAAGTLLYKAQYPTISWRDALNVPVILLLGGYDELFGGLTLPFAVPAWLSVFSLGLTIAGTLFLGIVYATLTEQLLSARFRFHQQRPPAPKANHVVLVGLGRVGQGIAGLLQRLKQPAIGINETELPPETLSHLPTVVGNLREGLQSANLTSARSVVAVTADDVRNLEVALEARAINPACRLVVRMDDPAFSGTVHELVSGVRAFGTYALAAEAFAAAAFGEMVHGLLNIDGTTVLVTEYRVEDGDTLSGRLLAEIAYGYGLVPIAHARAGRGSAEFLPSDDRDVLAGDRLIVLATSESLRRVEQGERLPPSWAVEVNSLLTVESGFDAAMTIARISGCAVATARAVIGDLPAAVSRPLYRQQALRLARELEKLGCRASACEGNVVT